MTPDMTPLSRLVALHGGMGGMSVTSGGRD